MTIKNILNLVPTIQSAALLNENVRVVSKKKVNSKDIVSLGMKNIIGISLIKAESDFIGTI